MWMLGGLSALYEESDWGWGTHIRLLGVESLFFFKQKKLLELPLLWEILF